MALIGIGALINNLNTPEWGRSFETERLRRALNQIILSVDIILLVNIQEKLKL